MEVDNDGINVNDFEDLLCSNCGNAPLAYYCPVCDFKVCLDCLLKRFRKQRNGALVCKQCNNVDKTLATFVGHGKA